MKLSASRLSLVILCLAQWVSAATVYFPITLTWANRTVAGVTRPIILTNGQFPGPPLRLTQNDDVIFDVKNLCPFTVTVHFHGMIQHLQICDLRLQDQESNKLEHLGPMVFRE